MVNGGNDWLDDRPDPWLFNDDELTSTDMFPAHVTLQPVIKVAAAVEELTERVTQHAPVVRPAVRTRRRRRRQRTRAR